VRARDPPGKMARLYGRQDARRDDCADNLGMRHLLLHWDKMVDPETNYLLTFAPCSQLTASTSNI